MKRILIAEDDAPTATIYKQRFLNAGFQTDIVSESNTFLDRVFGQKPDVVLLDLMLPEVNGIEILKQIRSCPMLHSLPVVVLTNNYRRNMLQIAEEAGATEVLTKFDHTPHEMIQIVQTTLDSPKLAKETLTESGTKTTAWHRTKVNSVAGSELKEKQACLESVPSIIQEMKHLLQKLEKIPGNRTLLHELHRRTHVIASQAWLAGLEQICRLTGALEALLDELSETPDMMNPSPVLTTGQALDTLSLLIQQHTPARKQDVMTVQVIIIDDDRIVLRTAAAALRNACVETTCVDNPTMALQILAQKQFDLVFLDIKMPEMDGFQLSEQLRTMPLHKKTPLVFLTAFPSLETLSKSILSGGDDFIMKPFLFTELTVKALSFGFKTYLQ